MLRRRALDAESAGMQVGDLIVQINGIQIKNALDMQQIASSPDDTATVTVQRESSEISFKVDILESPDKDR